MDNQMQQDPSAMGGDPGAASGAGEQPGYQICITVQPGNGITVGVETPDDGSDAGASGSEPSVPAGNIRDAIQLVMQIFQNNGQMPSMNDDSDFNSGFGGAQKVKTDRIAQNGDDQ